MGRARMSASARAPEWIRAKALRLSDLHAVKTTMRGRGLHTVCEEAKCPNRSECFSRGTATFLLMGDVCTRACGFCDIANGRPAPLDPREPRRVADAVREMGLRHVVLTSVDRDDLDDGGAAHFARTIGAIRELDPAIGVEVLTPDFRGRMESVAEVVAARPDVFNHNVETVPRLYASVRRGARLDRSLSVLAEARRRAPGMATKSGFMLGLGETFGECIDLMRKMKDAAVEIVTIGQYLRPSRENLPVVEYVRPEAFEALRREGETLGFRHVFAGPFVRSSYRAEEALLAVTTSKASPHPPSPSPGGVGATER
ncbi:MAG TPA: lipoyl synthase [Thermoanaerobaculia bacterium]|nr:lipoyl synthase [Thermoanaerobaculia bacterium]